MNKKHRLAVIYLFSLFVVTASSLPLLATSAETADTRIVECWVEARVADTDPKGINVRSGPGESYPVVDTLSYRSPVTISGSVGEWMCINEDSPRRWVYGPLLAVFARTDPNFPYGHDPSGLVPIYGEFGDDVAIIAWAPQNTEVTVLGCTYCTVKVRYNGTEGWLNCSDHSQDLCGAWISSGGAKTPVMEVVPCDSVAAYVIDKDPKGANVREGPGSDYSTILTLPTDRPVQVRIVGSLKDWVLIKNAVFTSKEDGQMTMDITVWVKATLLGVRTHNADDLTDPVNLYKEPDTGSEAVAEVQGDTLVTVLAAKGAWLKVRHEKQEGWLPPDAQCGDPFKECH